MQKFLTIFVVAVLLCLSACKASVPNETDVPTKDPNLESTTADTLSTSTTNTPSETPETIPHKNDQLPLPNDGTEFFFLSGAGAWRTIITLNRDGTFTGWYLDSEMGDTGEGYPNGSAYTCTFSGKFENIEKVNEYSYKMTLADVKTEKAVGEEWIEDEIRYIASTPHGLDDPDTQQECTEFIFYLPNTPIDHLSEEFLTWWPYGYTQGATPNTTLSCYGILNVTSNFGFFTSE